VNRALSTANACLYGICHSAILSAGFSAGLGFVHSGKMLSFVYDVADLYKCDVTIPVAFEIAVDGWSTGVESRVRRLCRDRLWEKRILERVIPDIQSALGLKPERVQATSFRGPDELTEPVTGLWTPDGAPLAGGHNYGEPSPGDEDDRS